MSVKLFILCQYFFHSWRALWIFYIKWDKLTLTLTLTTSLPLSFLLDLSSHIWYFGLLATWPYSFDKAEPISLPYRPLTLFILRLSSLFGHFALSHTALFFCQSQRTYLKRHLLNLFRLSSLFQQTYLGHLSFWICLHSNQPSIIQYCDLFGT